MNGEHPDDTNHTSQRIGDDTLEDTTSGDRTTVSNTTYNSMKKAETYGSLFESEAFWIHVDDYSLKQMLGDLTDKSVLEMGCGEGRICRKLISWYPIKRLTGLDFSVHCVETARRISDKHIEYVHGDAATGFSVGKPESFDVVLTVYVLQYAENYDQTLGFLRTAYNNLKPGGRFVGIFSAFSPCMALEGYNQFFKAHYKWVKEEYSPYGPIHSIMYNGDTTASLEMLVYALYPEIFEKAIKEVGFSHVTRHPIRVDPDHEHQFDMKALRHQLRYVYHFEAFKP